MASARSRDTSRDGLRNRLENALLSHGRPFWSVVNRTPWLAGLLNRIIVDNAASKAPARPLALATGSDYSSWTSLTDRTWFSRYLPPRELPGLPDLDRVAALYRVRPAGPRISQRSTFLFPSFAQWFTDGFLMTDDADRRRTHTNHQIDLGQVYGLNPAATAALRGERGRLRSVLTETGEWAPPLFDEAGVRAPGLEALPNPTRLPDDLPPERKHSIFAFGGERANATTYTAMVNTLFLREHNRLAAMLEAANPGWDDDRVFEVARNINIVQLINVVVCEYINHISPYWFQFLGDPAPAHHADWNRPNWIPVEFNLLYRWHSLVPEQVTWRGAALDLADCRFDNRRLLADGLAAAFTSASDSGAWRIGLFNTVPFLQGVELDSVRQGRINRLASYNDYREAMKYPRLTRFEQISGDLVVIDALRRLYGEVDRVEFFVGLFAEDLPPRSAVPPLIGRMVAADAFSHALTNPLLAPHLFHEGTFTRNGMATIRATRTLKHILDRNAAPAEGAYRATMDAPGYASSA